MLKNQTANRVIDEQKDESNIIIDQMQHQKTK